MKKLFSIIAVVSVIAFASCIKSKDTSYTCACTYVASANSPSAGQPNKNETTTIKDNSQSDAQVQCASLDGKYDTQYFTGTCVLQ